MTAREELAQSIATNLDRVFGRRDFGPATQDYELADALLAEGWGKRRTVATVEELDALPMYSVVRSAARFVYQCDSEDDIKWWARPGEQRIFAARKLSLPATVLYEPQP